MSTVLIVAESQPDGQLRKATFHAVAAGKALAEKTGATLHLAVLAKDPAPLAEKLKGFGAAAPIRSPPMEVASAATAGVKDSAM